MVWQTQPTPLFLIFFLACAVMEWMLRRRSHRSYSGRAAAASLGVGVGRGLAKAATAGFVAAVLMACYQASPTPWPMDDWRSWAAGFLLTDFTYYWQHRWSHTIRWFWANHATHHSSNELNLPAAFRLSWTADLTGVWLFFLPAIYLGLHPAAMWLMLIINLRYQLLLHTEAVGKLGPLEWVLNTPSHHRVHHASNPAYLDKNFGGMLIVFDRLFGTFAEERIDQPPRYGLTDPLASHNPFVIVFHEWGRLFRDMWAERRRPWASLCVLAARPGRRPRDPDAAIG